MKTYDWYIIRVYKARNFMTILQNICVMKSYKNLLIFTYLTLILKEFCDKIKNLRKLLQESKYFIK